MGHDPMSCEGKGHLRSVLVGGEFSVKVMLAGRPVTNWRKQDPNSLAPDPNPPDEPSHGSWLAVCPQSSYLSESPPDIPQNLAPKSKTGAKFSPDPQIPSTKVAE
ncbi:hypothetical protein Bbelb_090680 [Branchiostoma belcheri]|nr:hypothetical protein Bbelb_090680 [Branchiostoma belcheri]